MLRGVITAPPRSPPPPSSLRLALLGTLGGGLPPVVSLYACLRAQINRHLNTPLEMSDRVALHRRIQERNPASDSSRGAGSRRRTTTRYFVASSCRSRDVLQAKAWGSRTAPPHPCSNRMVA